MTTFSDLEKAAIATGAFVINIHRHSGGWRAHCRFQDSSGFRCGQVDHPTIESALREHFPDLGRRPAADPFDLSDLLA